MFEVAYAPKCNLQLADVPAHKQWGLQKYYRYIMKHWAFTALLSVDLSRRSHSLINQFTPYLWRFLTITINADKHLIDWLIDWLINWLVDWLIDRFDRLILIALACIMRIWLSLIACTIRIWQSMPYNGISDDV